MQKAIEKGEDREKLFGASYRNALRARDDDKRRMHSLISHPLFFENTSQAHTIDILIRSWMEIYRNGALPQT
jgi:hypothetical protein